VRLKVYIILFFSISVLVWAKPESISVVIDNNYPPYSFLDKDGQLVGLSIDLWDIWERKTGIKVKITGTNWKDAQMRMENGEFDVIDTMFYTEERAKKYDFSKPYTRIDVVIFFRNTISGITDIKSLMGLMVGVKRGDADIDFLKKHNVDHLVEYDNYEDIIIAAKDDKIKIFVVDKPPGIFYLLKHRVEDKFNFSEPLFFGDFHRAVKKGNFDLLALIEDGFQKVSEEEITKITQRYLGYSTTRTDHSRLIAGLLIILIILSGSLLASYLWNRSLKKAVQERISEIQIARDKSDILLKELSEKEQRLLYLYENIPDAIYSMTIDGQILDINPQGLRTLGYSKEELSNLKITDIVIPEDLEKVNQLIKNRIAGDTSPYEFRIKTRKGDILIIETKSTVLYKDGKPYAFQTIARDITKQREIEKSMFDTQKLESIGLLAGGIAHELNNILMGIINYTEFINRDYGNKDLFLSDINHLKNTTEKAAKLVQQLLGFSRKQMIFPQALDINDVISNLKSSFFNFLGENIIINLSLSDKKPVIFADRSQVEQILVNLLINSKDAMPEGGKIKISTDVVHLENEKECSKTYNGDFVLISVSDTGCGIKEEDLRRVFEPFFTTKPVGRGTGLGLAMVYGAMQQNKGFVRINSYVEQGTTVKLYFPLSKEKMNEPAIKERPVLSDNNSMTILLVEDNDGVRNVIKQILNNHNYNVIEARDVSEAIKEFEYNSDLIKLVITDIVMPYKDGMQLKNIINEKFGDIKFIFITGYSEEVLRAKGVEIGENELLYKPFNTEQILFAIKRATEPFKKPI